MIIRRATEADLDAILAIHNAAILDSTALWTDEIVERSDREEWLATHQLDGTPVLVADVDGEVAGYASYSQWRSKYGYRFSVEDSIYLAPGYQGRGFGRALMIELIALARTAGKHVMVADIESTNTASIRLHDGLGFVTQGVIRELGRKFDRWLDLTIMVLRLDD